MARDGVWEEWEWGLGEEVHLAVDAFEEVEDKTDSDEADGSQLTRKGGGDTNDIKHGRSQVVSTNSSGVQLIKGAARGVMQCLSIHRF